MRLDELMDELFTVLEDVPGLNTVEAGVTRVSPPAPYIDLPNITYGSMGPGLDRIPDLELVVYFGQPTERGVFRDALEYASTSGPRSIPAALAAHEWTTCHTLRVGSAERTVDNVNGHPALGYVFHLDITGAP